MALNNTALNTAGTAIAAQITYVSLHTSGAVTSSTSESAAARQPVTWSVSAGGNLTASNIAFTGGTASGPVVRVGYWSASTAGTYLGGSLLTGDQAFNAAGAYTVTSIAENVSSS